MTRRLGGWADEAACLGMDPTKFFPPDGHFPREGIAVCAGCSLRSWCLSHALSADEHHGVWGGMTPSERAEVDVTWEA